MAEVTRNGKKINLSDRENTTNTPSVGYQTVTRNGKTIKLPVLLSDTKTYPQKEVDRMSAQLLVNNVENPLEQDNRNIIEKITNLPEGQNWLFDTFELLGRSQQALFGAIDEGMRTGTLEGALEGGIKGLTGEKDTTGGQILRGFGIGDSETFGVDDVLGFAADVLLDPLDLALIPVTGGTSLLAKGASKVDDVADAVKIADKAVDSTKQLKSVNDVLFGLAGEGIKKGVKTADDLVGAGLRAIDKGRGIEFAGDTLLNPNVGMRSLSNIYEGSKKGIAETFNSGANWLNKTIRDTLAEREGITSEATERAMAYYNKLNKDLDEAFPRIQKLFANDPELADLVKDKESFNKFLDQAVESIKEGNIARARDINALGDVAYKVSNGPNIINNNPNVAAYIDEMTQYLGNEANAAAFARKQLDTINADKQAAFRNLATSKGAKTYGDLVKYSNQLDDQIKELTKVANSPDFSLALDALNASKGKGNVIVDDNTLDAINRASYYYGKKIGDDGTRLANIKDSMRLADDSTIMRGFNKIKEAYPELADSVENIYKNINKEIDDVLKKIPYKDRSVKDVINDYEGYSKEGTKLGDYESYARTQVNENVLDILGIDKTKGTIFTDRQNRLLDTTTLNNMFANMSTDDLAKLFPGRGYETLEKLSKTLKEEGLYRNDLAANVFDVASSLPKYASNSGLKTEIVSGLGAINLKDQIKSGNEIDKITKELASKTKQNAPVEEINQLKNELGQARKRLQGYRDDAIFKSISSNVFDNTGKKANIKEIRESLESFVPKKGKVLPDELVDVINDIESIADEKGNVLVNPTVYNMLRLNADGVTSAKKSLLMIDKLTNIFKRNKLLSPGYNIRNITGNMFNMYVAGVPSTEIPSLIADSVKTYQDASKAIKLLEQGNLLDDLPGNLREAYDEINKLRRYGFGDAAKTATELAGMESVASQIGKSSNPLVKGLDKLNEANLNLNMQVDNISRLAMMKYANNHPSYLKKMGFENAGQAIAYSLFDPSNLSDIEKNVFKKIVPFYTFTKKNLAFQINNLSKNATKYSRVLKSIDSAWGSEDDENIADYYKTGLAIPLGRNEDGTTTVFNANLPLSDLLEWTTDPGTRLTSSITPAIRSPFEWVTNQEMFTGQPISEFEGQESELFNKFPLADLLPDVIDNAKTEYLISQFGLDVPLKQAANAIDFGAGLVGLGDETVGKNLLDAIGVFGTNNPETVQYFRDDEDMRTLRDYIKYIEQEQGDLQSVTEFEDANKGKINREFQRRIDTLMGRK